MEQKFKNAILHFAARYPEWWVLALSLGSWIWIVLLKRTDCCSHYGLGDLFSIGNWSESLMEWLLMTAAMMIPLLIPVLRIVAFRSLWRRRHRAIAGFLLGYFTIWLLVGIAWLILLTSIRAMGWNGWNLWIMGFLIAAAWQISSFKRLAQISCHRTIPLGPDTWKADLDCLRYGAIHGRSCATSCWALMFSTMLVSPSPFAMMGTCLVCVYQRYRARLEDRKIAVGLALLAAGMFAFHISLG
jgi:predicted metal-binding membrane protein